MKLGTMLSDGSALDALELDVELLDQNDNAYDPPVIVRCRYIDRAERREIEDACQKFVKNKKTRGMEAKTDWLKVAEEVTVRAVQSWTNIFGADDKPLVCTDHTKRQLPPYHLYQITQAVTNAEADLRSESFPQSA